MNATKIRKEVSLDENIVEKLKILASKDGRSLKNFMERKLYEAAEPEFEITEKYKEMMDEMIEKDKNGALKFVSMEEMKSKIQRKSK